MKAVFLAGLLVAGMAQAGDAQDELKASAVTALDSSVERQEANPPADATQSASVQDIRNFHQMTDSIAIGGQPTVSQLAQIADAGYSVVVNLATHDSDGAIPAEGSVIASLGLTYVHIPVPTDAPTPRHLQRFFRIMDSVDEENVFVHCASSGRVSAFMHRYLMLRKGASAEQATSPLLQRWLPNMQEPWTSILNLDLDEIDPPAAR